ncbi:MAG: helix-turn-helix domain-containing protein [Candidatus Cryptobacteroides sp.]
MHYSDNDIIFTDDISSASAEELSSTDRLVMMYCRKGHLSVQVDGARCDVGSGEFLICLPGMRTSGLRWSKNPDFTLLCVSEKMFSDVTYRCLRREPRWWQKQEFVNENTVARPDSSELEVLESYIRIISLQFRKELTPKRVHIIRTLAEAAVYELLLSLDSRIKSAGMEIPVETERRDYIMHAFVEQVRTEGSTRHSVAWYAEQLCITPKYLSEICRRKTGKGASTLLKEALLKEVCYLLSNTELTVKEISYRTGFAEEALLCRWFRNIMQMTPLEYRSGTLA